MNIIITIIWLIEYNVFNSVLNIFNKIFVFNNVMEIMFIQITFQLIIMYVIILVYIIFLIIKNIAHMKINVLKNKNIFQKIIKNIIVYKNVKIMNIYRICIVN